MKTKMISLIIAKLFIIQAITFAQGGNSTLDQSYDKGTKTGITLIEYEENFDGDSLVYNPNCILTIDTTLSGNIWQIGQPQKVLFDSAYSAPNALVTDTVNPYPPNNYSIVEFSLKKPEWATYNCWSFMYLAFAYRMDTDTLRDGFYMEISYDGGLNWSNIITDTIPDYTGIGNAYHYSDTLFDGEFGLSGTSHMWSNDTIPWTGGGFDLSWNDSNAHIVDSCRIRLVFISDGIETSKDGVLIDRIGIEVVDLCNVGIEKINKENFNIEIYPNPITKNSVINIPGFTEEDEIRLEIFDLLGNMVFQYYTNTNPIPLHDVKLTNGLYLIKVAIGTKLFTTKRIFFNN